MVSQLSRIIVIWCIYSHSLLKYILNHISALNEFVTFFSIIDFCISECGTREAMTSSVRGLIVQLISLISALSVDSSVDSECVYVRHCLH